MLSNDRSHDFAHDFEAIAHDLVQQYGPEKSLHLVNAMVQECRQVIRADLPRPKQRPSTPGQSL